MVFPGIFGTHYIYQQTHSPFTDVSINKDFFEKIFLIKVSCCWFTCEKFVFNVSLPITLCDKPTQYSTQYLIYIVFLMLSLSLILTPCLMIAMYVAPPTDTYFDEVSFAATYSDHVLFFFIPLVLCLVCH